MESSYLRLNPVDWQIARRDEAPHMAPMTVVRYPIAKYRTLIITNVLGGARAALWFVAMEHGALVTANMPALVCMITTAHEQSEAWNSARSHCWQMYGVDIAKTLPPF